MLPETRVPAKDLATDSMLLVFTQLFFEVARSEPAKPAKKAKLDTK